MYPLFFFKGVNNIKELLINDEIKFREVRLIDSEGNQVGVVPNRRAQEMAMEAGLDLVCVAPAAKPPVCKIMDYGKYRYDMIKKEKESKKAQKVINVKEIRLTPNIDTHDLQVKANRAAGFLKDEDKVKVSVRFRGREMGHTDLGKVVLEDFIELLGDVATVDQKPKLEGRNMTMMLLPNKNK